MPCGFFAVFLLFIVSAEFYKLYLSGDGGFDRLYYYARFSLLSMRDRKAFVRSF